MFDYEAKYKELLEFVKKDYDESFDYDQEYWESGNMDDCYEYGFESGMNKLAEQILKKFS